MSIQNNFPAIKPTLLLDFANTKQLDPRVTFTRASTATYFDALGVMKTAASGVARFDNNPTTFDSLGLLIEESRTNLLTYSQQLDNAYWGSFNSTVTSNSVIAPDGTLTGDTLIPNTSTSEHNTDSGSVSITSGNTYTFTAYVKTAGLTDIGLRLTAGSLWTGGASPQVRFDLINLTATTVGGTPASASITNAGNGWYRAQMSVTAVNTGNASARFQLMSGINNIFAGNGFSGIYIWGAQLEAGAFATSYIPTVASQVTRAADAASMTGANFSSWYNQAEGTMYVESGPSFPVANIGQISLTFNDGGSSNRMYVGKKFDSTTVTEFGVTTGGVSQAFVLSTPTASMTNFKLAASYRFNDFVSVASGGAVGTDALGTVPVVNQLLLGRIGTSSDFLNGTIRKIAYYPIRVSNTQLSALTS